MRKIDVEAHFYTEDYQQYLLTRKTEPREEIYSGYVRLWYAHNIWEPHGTQIEDKLLEHDEIRLNSMDGAEIEIQVLSLSTPGCEQFGLYDGTCWSKKTNDALAELIKRYPGRYAGLAALAPQDTDNAVKELERAVKVLGLKGAKLNSHVGEDYLDNPKFWPIFEVAEYLNVPIYLHPNIPSVKMLPAFEDYGFALAGPALGFTFEAAVHVMRLIYSGLFDKFPALKIVLGHMGESLVHLIYRLDFSYKKAWMDMEIRPKISKPPSQYLRDNFWITTSGMTSLPAFLNAYLELGADRILFSSDYPYENIIEASDFIEKIPVNPENKEKILFRNAEKLFNLKLAQPT